MKKTKGKRKRYLAAGLSLALVLGSIQLIGAEEISPQEEPEEVPYEVSDLTLLQGDEDYDLTDGITYDSDSYELVVTDLGGFDINVPGEYEVGYTLTEKLVLGQESEESTGGYYRMILGTPRLRK